jgi:hypothetical protein
LIPVALFRNCTLQTIENPATRNPAIRSHPNPGHPKLDYPKRGHPKAEMAPKEPMTLAGGKERSDAAPGNPAKTSRSEGAHEKSRNPKPFQRTFGARKK